MPTTTARNSFLQLRDDLQSAQLASYPGLIARLAWSRPQIFDHQRVRLRELVAHAAAHRRSTHGGWPASTSTTSTPTTCPRSR